VKLSILTTITNPDERQDKWIQALSCYCDLADEVVVVNGGIPISVGFLFQHPKIKVVDLAWPYEWNWLELPKHLNAGREKCTGDWILKLDIDQFVHEDDFEAIRKKLSECPAVCQSATFQKMSLTYGGRYFQKGGQPIAFKNEEGIVIGKDLDKETDLCFAIKQESVIQRRGSDYALPVGLGLSEYKTGISYWNYDYFFKTKEFTKKEFWRFSKAYHAYFDNWRFGEGEEASFKVFMDLQKSRFENAPYLYGLNDHSKYIREEVKRLSKEQFGLYGWGLI